MAVVVVGEVGVEAWTTHRKRVDGDALISNSARHSLRLQRPRDLPDLAVDFEGRLLRRSIRRERLRRSAGQPWRICDCIRAHRNLDRDSPIPVIARVGLVFRRLGIAMAETIA